MADVDLEAILKRLEALESSNGELVRAVHELREAAIVTADVQRRQAETQQRQAEIQRMQAEGLAAHEERMRRVESNLAEISDKLNGLIGYIDNLPRRGPPEPPPRG